MSTFVYVSSAEAGEIGSYTMLADGALAPGTKVKVGEMGMPMAVSPDRQYLYAAGRTRPYAVHAYAIDPGSGALAPLASAPLAESCPYISLDRTGRYLWAPPTAPASSACSRWARTGASAPRSR